MSVTIPTATIPEEKLAGAFGERSTEPVERTITPEGFYNMIVKKITGRVFSNGGQIVEVFMVHADKDNSRQYKGATLRFSRQRDNKDLSTNLHSLAVLGKAAGLTQEEAAQLNWAIDIDAGADERGNYPAVIGLAGSDEGLDLINKTFNSSVKVDTYEYNGETRTKSVVAFLSDVIEA